MSQAAKKETPKMTPAPILSVEPVENRRILVVDDEVGITDGYQSILGGKDNVVAIRKSSRSEAPAAQAVSAIPSESKYDVVVANSADQALELVKKSIIEGKPFAMGFFDVVLGPGIDGIELVKKVHEVDNDLYAVFVTAYHDRGVDAINSLLGPAMADKWDYLNKPFSEGEITQKARNATTIWNLRRQKEHQDVKLAEANRRLHYNDRTSAVAAVSRGVGHEFGNILFQIIGRAELARAKGNPEEMKKALDMILTAGETATAILDRFKNLARSSESKVQKELIWANQPIEEALELLNHQFVRNSIRVTKIKNDRVQIKACHSSLVQVFVNLFINAVHAMGSPGQIDIAVKANPGGVEIRIRDYGPGIPTELQEKVMEAFFTTKGDKGTGLGLSICKEIVEIEHRGTLTVQNHPAKGAEFVITLPTNPEEEEVET